MAINGWYVKKIITDLQEGKVDEFIQKEGKWFNYIKGENTTFTSSIDNDNGEFSGNLDVTEFAVQGIGALSADATFLGVPDDEPELGGNLNVSFFNASGVAANWTATEFQQTNITQVPSSGTITITPDPGYGVSAAEFSAVSVTAASWITSITFADTGTPNTASNEVVATINFDTTQSISFGNDLIDSVSIVFSAASSLTEYQATIIIHGIFEDANGNIQDTIGLVNSSDYTLLSSTPTELTYSYSAMLTPGVNGILSLNYFYGSSVAPGSHNIFIDVPPWELSQYGNSIASISPTTSNFQVTYNPSTSQTIDGGNIIHIYTNNSLGVLYFNSALGNTSSTPLAALDDGGTQQINIVNTLPHSVTITATGSLASNILNLPLVVPAGDSSFDLVLAANTSGSSVAGTLVMTSNYTAPSSQAPQDTLFMEQGMQNAISVTAAVQGPDFIDPFSGLTYQPWTYAVSSFVPSPAINGYFERLDGNAGNPVISSSITTFIEVWAQIEENQPTNLVDNFSVNYTSGGTGWITATGGGGSGPDFFKREYYIQPNTTTSVREAYITYPHPQDPSLTDSLYIKQEAGYSAASNTFDFSDTSLAAPYKIADGVNLEIDYNPQTVTIWGAAPANDINADENPFNNNPLLAQVSYPNWIPPYYEKNFTNGLITYNINYANPNAIGVPDWGSLWFSNLDIQHNIPTIGSPPNITFGLPIQYQISFDVTENSNVVSSSDGFPIDRSFTLSGYNPLNTTSTADDTIIVLQKARPATIFNGGTGGFINDALTPATLSSLVNPDRLVNNQITVPSTFSGSSINIPLRSNSSGSPTVQTYATRIASYSTIGAPPTYYWDTNSTLPSYVTSINTTLNANSTYEYTVDVSLEENFSGVERAFTIAAYHNAASTSQLPTSQGIEADAISIVQETAVPFINIGSLATTGSIYGSSFIPVSVPYNSTYFEYQLIVNNAAQTVTIPINSFNGQDPYAADVNYYDGSGPISGSWANSGIIPSMNASNDIEIPLTTNSTGDVRALTFKLRHGNVVPAFHEFRIIQLHY